MSYLMNLVSPAGLPEELSLPPWPLHVRIANCNVDITDVPPEGSELEGMDAASPNPFLPSIMMIQDKGEAKVRTEYSKRL